MKHSWKRFFHSKPLKWMGVFALASLPVLTFVPLAVLNNQSTQTPSNNSITSISTIKSNEESHSYWPELTTNEIEFKTLMEVQPPTPSNLQELYDWAEENFNLPYGVSLSHDYIYHNQGTITEFNWSSVGYATTKQFELFLRFYGRPALDKDTRQPIIDPQTGQPVTGLSKFTSIVFTDTDIEFNLPEFWLSLAHYMPNLKTIKIKSNESGHRSLTALPKEIGQNSFNVIEIVGENIQDNYEDFLGWSDNEHKNSYPLTKSLTHLIIQNSQLKDHLVLDPENKEDKIRYFTEQVFENYSNLKHLQWLDLSGNELQHVKGNLICLPGIIELHLQNNQISDWHCVDANGSEFTDTEKTKRVSGLGQICFPNRNRISFVDISGNKLYQLVRLTHKEWNLDTLNKYIQTQKDTYTALNFVNFSNQVVDKKLFIFGNNIGANESDMNVDLTNMYVLSEDLASIDDEIQYISNCLKDRTRTIIDESTGKKKQLTPTIWNDLSLTENTMPSIVDLFGQFCNYVNYYDNQERTDIALDSGKADVQANDRIIANYYSKAPNKSYQPQVANPRYVATQTQYSIQAEKEGKAPEHENNLGANILHMQTNPQIGEEMSDFDYHPKNVAQDYTSSVQHTLDITPHFYIPEQMSPLHGLQSSKYHYDIQIFNAEQFVFYLTNITDEQGKPVFNDYIKSISDKDISVDSLYNIDNFWKLFSYSGNAEKKNWFQDNFNDRSFWNANFAVNNKETRVMTISITYPVYQYIGSTDAGVKPTKLTFNVKIPMYPFPDNQIQKVLTIVWIIELIAFVLLLIPLIIYWSRMQAKTKEIKQKKMKLIKAAMEKDAPKVKISENLTKERKLTNEEYRERLYKTGKADRVVIEKVDEKDVKPTSTSSKAIDVDSILKEIE